MRISDLGISLLKLWCWVKIVDLGIFRNHPEGFKVGDVSLVLRCSSDFGCNKESVCSERRRAIRDTLSHVIVRTKSTLFMHHASCFMSSAFQSWSGRYFCDRISSHHQISPRASQSLNAKATNLGVSSPNCSGQLQTSGRMTACVLHFEVPRTSPCG